MSTRITATELARKLGAILGRVRDRRESFVIERNGAPIARLEPVAGPPATAGEVLTAWRLAGPDLALAEALERVGIADRTPENPWDS